MIGDLPCRGRVNEPAGNNSMRSYQASLFLIMCRFLINARGLQAAETLAAGSLGIPFASAFRVEFAAKIVSVDCCSLHDRRT